MTNPVKALAGAPGIEPGKGGIKIASGKNKFNANSDSSCSVHIKQDQVVSTPVGTYAGPHPYHPAAAEADREQQKAHRIHIEPTTIRGDRGQYYRVHYGGALFIDETWNPEFEACRALLAYGIVGRLEVWRSGKSHPDMLMPDIAKAAEWTVKENETRGPHFARWQPRPEDLSQNAVSRAPEFLPAAVLGSGDPTQEPEPAAQVSAAYLTLPILDAELAK
jgi:hypothetical protein